MNRILVIGCPGSGKSTFARKLHRITGLPIYHLDQIFWNPDKTSISRKEFISKLQCILSTDQWIIDGNYLSSMELRLDHCDTVFFLDYPINVCTAGILDRIGQPRSDMPWQENYHDAEELLEYAHTFFQKDRILQLSLIEKHCSIKLYTFHNRSEADAYLQSIQK